MNEENIQPTPEEQLMDEHAQTKEKIFAIEVKMQELDAIIERFEDEFYREGENYEPSEEETNKVKALIEEYRDLREQKKQLQKTIKTSIWDHFPLWMGIYALFQIVFSFYLIMTQISMYFAQWFLKVVNGSTDFVFYVALFMIPFLNLVLPLLIFLLLKNKVHKRMFLYIYLIHGIETLIAVGMLLYVVLKR